MKKIKFSLIIKVIFLMIEIILIGNGVYLFTKDMIISIGCFFTCILIFIFENCYYSFIIFGNEIKIINKFHIKKIKYQEISRIEVSKSIIHVFSIGADIDIKLVFKNGRTRKVHLGQIIRYNKLINMIKENAKYRCVKFCSIE